MIKFGSTTVAVSHCTDLHLLLRGHYLFVDGVLTVRCPDGSIYRSMSRGKQTALKVVNKTEYGVEFSWYLFWYQFFVVCISLKVKLF